MLCDHSLLVHRTKIRAAICFLLALHRSVSRTVTDLCKRGYVSDVMWRISSCGPSILDCCHLADIHVSVGRPMDVEKFVVAAFQLQATKDWDARIGTQAMERVCLDRSC
jgi:hypothetical protein